ncbi:ceramide synthase 2-like isoform X2 [Mya arenaria]|nr:ceramide synthase 2-like isoform X2 [Mya arenaria]
MTPLGYWLGVKKKKFPRLNPTLEEYIKQNGSVYKLDTREISKQTDVPVRDVERWLRDRQSLAKPSDIKRFVECGWHFTFYSCSFFGGLVMLWQKSWFWTTVNCWLDWPNQHIDNDVYWYYLIELSFYWCLVFSVVTEHRRKDFVQMIVHHVVTILLVYFSWSLNFVRVGTLVLITHDAADFPMAAGKMMKYSGHKTMGEILLGVFIIVWILSRLIYYPVFVLYCSLVEIYAGVEPFPSYYFFNVLLIVLQVMHIIWTYMIARIAFLTISKRELKDVRSDSESDS